MRDPIREVVAYYSPAHTPWAEKSDELEALYARAWEVFVESAHRHGYRVVHLTTVGAPHFGDHAVEAVGDPDEVVYTRETAYLEYLIGLEDDDPRAFLEPDSEIMAPIPGLEPGVPLALADRRDDSIPMGVRVMRGSALPVQKALVAEMSEMTRSERAWHGDVLAASRLLGGRWGHQPKQVCGVSVEWRDSRDYGIDGAGRYVQNHKGQGKKCRRYGL